MIIGETDSQLRHGVDGWDLIEYEWRANGRSRVYQHESGEVICAIISDGVSMVYFLAPIEYGSYL